ncbi:LAMI_0E03356g1_1 [Lachancea mirantina]|uniref:Alpha-mannosidase n=1 Tax=Lachancea mirantina TaxID=1230905 RepID=A0A1G4JJP4_9SACH|nr:LAMI_0E03356g1_1 [Lachancea mirantina]
MVYSNITADPKFKPVPGIYEGRIRQFIDDGGEYRDLNLPKFYDKDRISLDNEHVKMQWYQVTFEKGSSPVSPDKRPSWKSIVESDSRGELLFRDAYMGQPFGPSWSTTWFKVTLRVPDEWVESGDQLVFEFDCENEGIVIDPETLISKTSFSGGGERTQYMLPVGQKHFHFLIECGNNGMFGCGAGSTINPPDNNRFFHLRKADLVRPNWEARALHVDFWMMSDAARELPGDTWQKHKAREICNLIMDAFDPEDVTSVERCRKLAKQEFFDKNLDTPGVYQEGDKAVATNVFAVGNCHIDTAWLWPFAETKRKVIRSWTSQTTLMDQYPEYQFVASQAQQFKWLLKEHPEFFDKVLLPKIQQSQFFPVGGSWVENDTNIPSGESLCRQFFYGQRFFLKYFGAKSDIFWLPDTFGYSSQIPQIAQISGITKFLTQKLSWNNINDFPHTTFNWSGIDGSQLLTHMPPGNTYTASSHFGDVLRSARQNKNLEKYKSGLMLYGIGDGGGGPTAEMLEKMRRIRSMSNRNGNVVPKLQVGTTIDEFYNDILQNTNDGEDLATWVGELYFEFHRGTYTTQAEVKRLMRLSEIKLHDLEWIATKTSILYPDDYTYPANDINKIWEDVLLCQFHDVLPGSCIEIVYKYEARPMLREAVEKTEKLIQKALEVLEQQSKEEKAQIGCLSLPIAIDEVSSEKPYLSKVIDTKDVFVLSNNKLEVSINKESGVITKITDIEGKIDFLDLKNGRNKLGANQFVLFDDKPLGWQAWDTELYSVNQYEYLTKLKSLEVVNNSDDLSTVRAIFEISEDCQVTTEISLASTSKGTKEYSGIEIKTVVENWNLRNKFLKVEFPVNVRNDFASYETQYGVTKRPTHYNTSWDVAKFEVCHHKFADYSEYSKGVSIINKSKYGFATHGNLMRLSLLRSPKAPDAHADMGTHEIKYAIYPHRGSLSSKTVQKALAFNYSFKYGIPKDLAAKFDEIISLGGDENLILANLKRGEDDKSLESEYALDTKKETTIVVRLYESLGGEAHGTLDVKLPIKRAFKIDNLETKVIEDVFEAQTTDTGTSIPIRLRPFEIATFKLVL